MVKHNDDPMNAMMLSNAGKIMAMTTNTIMTKIRMAILRMPRVYAESPVSTGDSEMAWGPTPNISSSVETIGRAFNGNLVRGMMAMNTLIITFSV